MTKKQNRREFMIQTAKTMAAGSLVSMFPIGNIPVIIKKNPLSPEHWNKDERDLYWRLTTEAHQPKPAASGKKAMVIGTTGAFAVRAGMEAIIQGGNALDSAITSALTQVALTAGGPVSYAGIMNLLYYDAGTRQVTTLDGGYNVPMEETDPLTIPRWGTYSGRSVLVPGFMPGIQAAHDKMGKIPFSHLFDPAIYLAEEGFEVFGAFEYMMHSRKDILGWHKEARDIFLKKDGALYKKGDTFRQPLLARTLKKIAKYGADYMAEGDWAKRFCKTMNRAGGKVNLKDLKHYRPIWSEPHFSTYNGYDVCTSYGGRPGGISLIESLNLMELAELHRYAPYTESPETFFWLTQIALMSMHMNFPDTAEFQEEFPSLAFTPEARVTKEQARIIWEKLRRKGWMDHFSPRILKEGSHSDGIISIDNQGNIAILSHSINSAPWGNLGLFVEGISIPDSGGFLQREMHWAGPGNRIWAGLNPHIFLRKGQPVLAGTSIGSSMHSTTLQRVLNVLDFRMDLEASIKAPIFHGPYFENKYIKIAVQDGTFSEDIIRAVRERGQYIALLKNQQRMNQRGYWIGLSINPETGVREGCTCWEMNGYALSR